MSRQNSNKRVGQIIKVKQPLSTLVCGWVTIHYHLVTSMCCIALLFPADFCRFLTFIAGLRFHWPKSLTICISKMYLINQYDLGCGGQKWSGVSDDTNIFGKGLSRRWSVKKRSDFILSFILSLLKFKRKSYRQFCYLFVKQNSNKKSLSLSLKKNKTTTLNGSRTQILHYNRILPSKNNRGANAIVRLKHSFHENDFLDRRLN